MYDLLKTSAFHVFHHDEWAAIFGFIDVVDSNGIAVLNFPCQNGLTQEPPDEFWLASQLRADCLQRSQLFEPSVHSFVHDRHAALSDHRNNPVFAANQGPFLPLTGVQQGCSINRTVAKISRVIRAAIRAGFHTPTEDFRLAACHSGLVASLEPA
jgi:hypothetical protein